MASVDHKSTNDDNIRSTSNPSASSRRNDAPLNDDEHAHTCNDPSHHHHHHHHHFNHNDLFESTTTGATSSSGKSKRTTKKTSRPSGIRTETIPGHRGNENIDDLMNFINGPSTSHNKKENKRSTGKTDAGSH
jgi:hypothetical protein